MATSLLVLIDDIATVLDDVAVLAKVAAKKTAGVLGDDLALNAQQVAGVQADRELPVIWAVCKGSLRNKLILVPAALLLSSFAPWAVTPLLMAGGLFLCFEGFEKVAHKLLHSREEDAAHHAALVQSLADASVDLLALEKEKIKGAIRTDFILSTEIIVIALGIVQGNTLPVQIGVLSGIAVAMTIGVYGFVAAIVKLDDLGLYLCRQDGPSLVQGVKGGTGRLLLKLAPALMRTLTVLGTVAMFLVGGGILAHGLPGVGPWIEHTGQSMGVFAPVAVMALDGLLGAVAGALTLVVVTLASRMKSMMSKK